MPDIYAAFWNVENLFDVVGSDRRSDKLGRTLRGELGGWSADLLDRKVHQLARVVAQMNGSRGPDLLCVAEVENAHVLALLCRALEPLGRDYRIAHEESSDGRGIDVGFIYDAGTFEAREQFSHVVVKRLATREIFQLNLVVRGVESEPLLVVVGNHWPARSGGTYASEPYRIVAAETLAYFHERIQEIHGPEVAVLALGDFNDEPFSRSLVDHALSESQATRVEMARTARLWNLMWPLLGYSAGTYYFQNRPLVLDQFLVSRGLVSGASGLTVLPETVEIVSPPETIADGTYPVPRRFGRGNSCDPDGYSDHFPIGLTLRTS